jgi:hypothetical protein
MKEKDLKINLLLALAIIIVITCDVFFVSQKEGYHMDEVLSYQLSNSEFTPWITPTQPEGRLEKYYSAWIHGDGFFDTLGNLFVQIKDILTNRSSSIAANMTADVYDNPQWMTSEQMTDYVLYTHKDSVPAISAYYNTTTDNHPPLYFMLLNIVSIISALFSYGTFSPWPGCILNMIFMAGSMILISRFFSDVVGKKIMGPVAALFYGLSPAGIGTVLLIRMYSMTAFFCIVFTYLIYKKLISNEDFKKGNKVLILVTVLGFLTQYFTCIYFFFLTVCVICYLVFTGKKKNALYLLRAMVISAVWGIGLYPFVFHDLFGTQIGESVRGSMSGFSGFGEKLMIFAEITAKETAWSAGGAIVFLSIFILSFILAAKNRRITFYVPALCISCLFYILTVSKIAPYTVDRYLMPVFPIVTICIALGMGYVIKKTTDRILRSENSRARIYAFGMAACAFMSIGMIFIYEPDYLFTGYSTQYRISERYSGYDAVVVYEGTGFYRNVPELMNYKNCLLLKEDDLEVYDERLASLSDVILIEGAGVEKDRVIAMLGKEYGFSSLTVLMEEGVFGDRVCLLSK